MLRIILSIILASVTWRGLSILVISDFMNKPLWANKLLGEFFINIYILFVLPLAVLNGYYIAGYKGFIIVGIGTLLGKPLVNEISKNLLSNWFQFIHLPTLQVLLFGTLNIIFTIVNCFII